MSAEKREELASTRSYDYGGGGWADAKTKLMVRRMSWARSWLEIWAVILLMVLLGMVGFMVWVVGGVWEDVGYLLEYRDCGGWDAGELEIDVERSVGESEGAELPAGLGVE